MKPEKIPYEKQIFVCTNDRKGEKPSCGDQKGEDIFNELRRIAKERGLHPRIRVAQAKCLGQCNLGCNVMVYPDGLWHKGIKLENIQEFANQYLVANKKELP